MGEAEWAALDALQVFDAVTFTPARRHRTRIAGSVQQARQVIEAEGTDATVTVSRPEERKYIIKFTW